jgi:HAD superfamily hydrolase (TIGR01509 family)
MTFKGIFFDLYGTLLVYGDMQAAWSDWMMAFYDRLRTYGLAMSQEYFAERCDGFFGRPAPPVVDDGLTAYERRIKAFGAEMGLDLGELQVQKAADASVNAWQQHISLDPEARSALATLRLNRTLALVSNFDHPPHVYLLLAKLGLVGLFDAVVISGDVSVEKPDPRIFTIALARVGLEPREVVYVGDTADDVQGALAAGLCPILIRRAESGQEFADFTLDQQPVEPVAVDGVESVSRLSDLVEMFRRKTARIFEEEEV